MGPTLTCTPHQGKKSYLWNCRHYWNSKIYFWKRWEVKDTRLEMQMRPLSWDLIFIVWYSFSTALILFHKTFFPFFYVSSSGGSSLCPGQGRYHGTYPLATQCLIDHLLNPGLAYGEQQILHHRSCSELVDPPHLCFFGPFSHLVTHFLKFLETQFHVDKWAL